ncbi:hypothetical protein Pelo_10294 [Pelomyxa schiedti]|nr:hypothetical protein Pelo_10294 [Pelomyxa schiedti]
MGLSRDLSKIKDTVCFVYPFSSCHSVPFHPQEDSEEEDTVATKQKPDAKPPHDVVHFHSAWKLVCTPCCCLFVILSTDFEAIVSGFFERMRGVCKGLLELVKSLERAFWGKLQHDFCNPRDRQYYMKVKNQLRAVRAAKMTINCSPASR